jgi:hypothetical protein
VLAGISEMGPAALAPINKSRYRLDDEPQAFGEATKPSGGKVVIEFDA